MMKRENTEKCDHSRAEQGLVNVDTWLQGQGKQKDAEENTVATLSCSKLLRVLGSG